MSKKDKNNQNINSIPKYLLGNYFKKPIKWLAHLINDYGNSKHPFITTGTSYAYAIGDEKRRHPELTELQVRENIDLRIKQNRKKLGLPTENTPSLAAAGLALGSFYYPWLAIPDIIFDTAASIDEPSTSNNLHTIADFPETVAKFTPSKIDDYIAKGVLTLGNIDDAVSTSGRNMFSIFDKKTGKINNTIDKTSVRESTNIRYRKNGGQIRKMQTAAGGPLFPWLEQNNEWTNNWKFRTTPASRSRVLSGKGVETDKQYTERRKKEETKRTWRSDAADVAHEIGEGVLALHPYTAIPYFGAKTLSDFVTIDKNGVLFHPEKASWLTALNASVPLFHLAPAPVSVGTVVDNALEDTANAGILNNGIKTLWNNGKLILKDIPRKAENFYRAVNKDAINDAKKYGIIRGRESRVGDSYPFFGRSSEPYHDLKYVIEGTPESADWISTYKYVYSKNPEIVKLSKIPDRDYSKAYDTIIGSPESNGFLRIGAYDKEFLEGYEALPMTNGQLNISPSSNFVYWKKHPIIGWRKYNFKQGGKMMKKYQKGTINGGILPDVEVTPTKLYLETYYPGISKYPATGHSALYGYRTYPKGYWYYNFDSDEEPESARIDKKSSDAGYNFVTNNCADATRCALEAISGKKMNPNFFTTPGDVLDFFKENFDVRKSTRGGIGESLYYTNITPALLEIISKLLKALIEANRQKRQKERLLAKNLKGGKMNIIEFLKKGSGIHIKKKNRGSFTRWCGGNVTEECILRGKNSSNPKIRKKATFADNVRHFKHRLGGILYFLLEGGNLLNSDTALINGIGAGILYFTTNNQLSKMLNEFNKSMKAKYNFLKNNINMKAINLLALQNIANLKLTNPEQNFGTIDLQLELERLRKEAAAEAEQLAKYLIALELSLFNNLINAIKGENTASLINGIFNIGKTALLNYKPKNNKTNIQTTTVLPKLTTNTYTSNYSLTTPSLGLFNTPLNNSLKFWNV